MGGSGMGGYGRDGMDNQGGYGSVGRMGMGNNYSGGYGTPDGLGGYGECLFLFHLSPHMWCSLKFIYCSFF